MEDKYYEKYTRIVHPPPPKFKKNVCYSGIEEEMNEDFNFKEFANKIKSAIEGDNILLGDIYFQYDFHKNGIVIGQRFIERQEYERVYSTAND